MLGIRTVEFQFGFQRDAVGQTSVQAFIYRVAWRVDEIVHELQDEIVPGVGNRKYFLEYFEQSFITREESWKMRMKFVDC